MFAAESFNTWLAEGFAVVTSELRMLLSQSRAKLVQATHQLSAEVPAQILLIAGDDELSAGACTHTAIT